MLHDGVTDEGQLINLVRGDTAYRKTLSNDGLKRVLYRAVESVDPFGALHCHTHAADYIGAINVLAVDI